MRTARTLLAVGLWLSFSNACAARSTASPQIDPARGDALRTDMQQLIGAARDSVFPALVNIRVVTVVYQNGAERKYSTIGSGTIFSKEGYVLTNQHVVRHGRRFVCTLADKQEIPARLVGADALTDLAVLQLDLKAVKGNLSVARFGDSDQLQVGETVMAMGSPLALSRSVTLGIVSNTHRILNEGIGAGDGAEMMLERGQSTGLFTRWIQHDALIFPGSSGGPLVNLRGEVVGVNELGGGFGFAIPSQLAKEVTAELVAHGEVPRSWLGMNVRSLQKTGLNEGALVTSIDKDSPSQKAGLLAGDLITAVDGKPVALHFAEEIPPFLHDLASRPPNSKVALEVKRAGKTLTLTATTDKLAAEHGAGRVFRAWGFTAEDVTSRVATAMNLGNTDGALVTGVKPGSPAARAEPAVKAGDVLRSIDGVKTPTLASLLERYAQLTETKDAGKAGKPAPILLELQRHGENQVTLLKPTANDDDEQSREIPKGWLGVATQPVIPELADKLGLHGASGYRVSRVYPGTTAERGGLKVGDLIIAAGTEKFQPGGMSDASALERLVRRHYEGDSLSLTVRRGDAKDPLVLTVVLERSRLAADEAPRARDNDFELTVRELTFFDRDDRSWGAEIHGVLVASVESAGWAGLAGVQPGDLLQSIDGREVKDLATFRAAMESVSKAKPARFVMQVLRGARTHYEFLEPDWKPIGNGSADASDDAEGD
jgi:serine protease Do